MVDRDTLLDAARAVRAHAHAPYSRFMVGAAVLSEAGRIFTGCNVENAAYPLGLCAEANAIGAMIAAGDRIIRAVAVVGGEPGDGRLCTPCGGCRQRIREFAAGGVPVHVGGPEGWRKSFSLCGLLPDSFGPENLNF